MDKHYFSTNACVLLQPVSHMLDRNFFYAVVEYGADKNKGY